jgi:hypothetical protein
MILKTALERAIEDLQRKKADYTGASSPGADRRIRAHGVFAGEFGGR